MRIALLTVCLTLVAKPALSDPPSKYTMEDLKALAESESWNELLEHVEDVRPSERKQAWRALLEKAAAGSLDLLLAQKKDQEALLSADQHLVRFPTLKQSKPFMSKRAEAGLAVYGDCLAEAHGSLRCVDDLDTFVKADPNEGELAFRAGKVVIERGHLWNSGPRFFVRALVDPARRKAGCSDPSVVGSLLRSLGHPPDSELTKAATTIAFEYCWSELSPKLLEAFYASGGYESKNLCSGLERKGAKLSAFQQAYCKDQLR
jgi:hypothetical protein